MRFLSIQLTLIPNYRNAPFHSFRISSALIPPLFFHRLFPSAELLPRFSQASCRQAARCRQSSKKGGTSVPPCGLFLTYPFTAVNYSLCRTTEKHFFLHTENRHHTHGAHHLTHIHGRIPYRLHNDSSFPFHPFLIFPTCLIGNIHRLIRIVNCFLQKYHFILF